MSDDAERPIIIKRIKKGGGDGHHGGAWKVAYADFVTAMMAFFLLMWLLNATTEVQRKGLADYFNPTIPVNRVSGGGEGAFGGDDVLVDQTMARNGTGASGDQPADASKGQGADNTTDRRGFDSGKEDAEKEEMEALKDMLSARAGESMVMDDIARHVLSDVNDEGLVAELFDVPGSPLFVPGTTQMTPTLMQLIDHVAGIYVLASNEVAVNNYMRTEPLILAENPVWELSAGRAKAVRQYMQDIAFPERRFQRVTGFADRSPIDEDPLSVRNNRIEIILLRDVNG